MTQKYEKGDHVMIAKDLGECMSHFTCDAEAIIIGSYADQYGGKDTKSYTIHIKGHGQVSWYREHQLSLIKSDRIDLLGEWEDKAKIKAEREGDIDWIFANGEEVLSSASGATVGTLAGCFGLTNLWGTRGEGYIYHQNAMGTMRLARPFLEKGDKAGWLEKCSQMTTDQKRSHTD